MTHLALMQFLGPDTVKQMIRAKDHDEWEAQEGICAEEPGDCFVAAEDREPSPVVSLADDIPNYFAGVAWPNPVIQEDGS